MKLDGKKITILGMARSGMGAAKLTKRLGGEPFVSDASDSPKTRAASERLKELGVAYELGGHSERIYDADVVVLSPGVPSDAPPVVEAKRRGIPVIGEVEFAGRYCEAFVAAVTGTNGKTTATSLVAHLLATGGKPARAAGNIGFAFSETALDATADDYVALEVSSFQLDFIDRFRPNVGMLLNVTPDHLDRYENDYEKYIAAKYRMFVNQTSDDLAVINADDPIVGTRPIDAPATIRRFSTKGRVEDGCGFENGEIVYREGGEERFRCSRNALALKGEHNLANAAAAIVAAKRAGVSNDAIVKGLGTFVAVEHRLEPLGEINGIQFVNDSKATNVDAVRYALGSFESPILLVLGGRDKGNDYDAVRDLVERNVKKVYAIGESAELVERYFKEIVEVERLESLEACVTAALKDGAPGDVALLSPACASFDMFESYERRGEVFKKAFERAKS
jgi:UDP-N-acetylmuramoylalanine--D-glutamate ligase